VVLARSIHDEIRSQTVSCLIMLPRSSIWTVYAKFLGALAGCLPGIVIELALAVLTTSGRHDLYELYMREPCSGGALTLLFLLVPHFSAAAATYLRWGAVPLGIGLTFGVYFGVIGAIELVQTGNPGEPFFAVVSFVMTCLCIACHLTVLLRFQALGAR
jgi:hypothetical protein